MKKYVLLMLAALLIIASCTKKAAPTATKQTTKPDPQTGKEDVTAGAGLFAHSCARCHGATGIEGKAPNLASTSASRPEIVEIVTKGQGRMPAFANKLSESDIASIAGFVVSLKN